MTEQELEKDLYQVANDIGYTRESDLQTLLSITKAYADAQVEASVARQQPIFEAAMNAKNAEIKRLRDKTREVLEKAASYEFFEKHAHRFIVEDSSFGGRLHPAMDYENYAAAITAIGMPSPAPVTEGKFSVSAYPKECVPTIEQLTENDGMSMMERLEKRMPPFHGFDSSKNEDQE